MVVGKVVRARKATSDKTGFAQREPDNPLAAVPFATVTTGHGTGRGGTERRALDMGD